MVLLASSCVPEAPRDSENHANLAGDQRVTHRAVLETVAGTLEYTDVLDHVVSADGSWVAVLQPTEGLAWSGTLALGPPDDLRPVATDVPRGLASCRQAPEKIVFTQNTVDRDGRTLWTADRFDLSQHQLADTPLDRLFGLDPTCTFALVVVRSHGLPIIAAVELATDRVFPLANHNVAYTPGARPQGFVTPPTYPTQLTWHGREFRYKTADGPVSLQLPDVEGTR